MLRHDQIDRRVVALAVTCTVTFLPTVVFGTESEGHRGVSPLLTLTVGCTAPCPAVAAPQDDFRSVGLRVTETSLRMPGETTTEAGVLLAGNHHRYVTAGYLTTRLREFGFFGGSSAGIEGGLGGDWAFGWRAPFSEDQGVFARIGLRGQLLGNGAFYGSALELPVGQAGYQLLRRRGLLLELAVTGAPMLVGRYNVAGASRRRLGGAFDWGGHLALALHTLHLEASYVRVVPNGDDRFGPMDWLTVELCARALRIAACADMRFLAGNVPPTSGSEVVPAQTWYLGAHFGLGTGLPETSARQSAAALDPSDRKRALRIFSTSQGRANISIAASDSR